MSKIHIPTARIIAFKSKKLADGSFPVNLVVTYKGRRKYFSLNMKATLTISGQATKNVEGSSVPKKVDIEIVTKQKPGNWKITMDEERVVLQRYKKTKKNYRSLNRQLDDYQRRANDIIDKLSAKGAFTLDRFDRFFSSNDSDVQVFQFLDTRYSELMKEDRVGTAYSLRDMSSFIKKYVNDTNIEWSDIDTNWLDRFKLWTRNYISESTKKHISVNTVAIYLRTLKAAYNEFYGRRGVKPEYHAFDGVKIETVKPPKKALSKDIMVMIAKRRYLKFSQKWMAQKYFLFSYLNNGMNFYDMAELTWHNISDGRINYTRRKTKRRKAQGESFSIKIELPTQKILDQFRLISATPFVFPILDPKLNEEDSYKLVKNKRYLFNVYIKKIAEDIGIPSDKVTTYSARHSFATVLKKNGRSIEIIQESLGHQSKDTTESYLGSFDHSVLDEANKHLL